jgi:hypothetical protein
MPCSAEFRVAITASARTALINTAAMLKWGQLYWSQYLLGRGRRLVLSWYGNLDRGWLLELNARIKPVTSLDLSVLNLHGHIKHTTNAKHDLLLEAQR